MCSYSKSFPSSISLFKTTKLLHIVRSGWPLPIVHPDGRCKSIHRCRLVNFHRNRWAQRIRSAEGNNYSNDIIFFSNKEHTSSTLKNKYSQSFCCLMKNQGVSIDTPLMWTDPNHPLVLNEKNSLGIHWFVVDPHWRGWSSVDFRMLQRVLVDSVFCCCCCLRNP